MGAGHHVQRRILHMVRLQEDHATEHLIARITAIFPVHEVLMIVLDGPAPGDLEVHPASLDVAVFERTPAKVDAIAAANPR